MSDQHPPVSTSFVELANAREPAQLEAMKKIQAEGYCPFCQEHLAKNRLTPVLHDGEYWFVTPNAWPYKHTKHHFLIISKPHWEKLADVPHLAAAELFAHLQWIEKEYDFPGGGIGWRFGDPKYSGGTVKHLHLQVLTPDFEDPEYEPVRLKIGTAREKVV